MKKIKNYVLEDQIGIGKYGTGTIIYNSIIIYYYFGKLLFFFFFFTNSIIF